MNEHREFANNELPDAGLLRKLSGLRYDAPQGSIDPSIVEKLNRDLCQRNRRKSRQAEFCRKAAGDYWEAVLISILFCLLGLDLLRIIRFVLN